MKLFGWKSAGRDAVRPVLSRVLGGVPLSEWPQSYEGQVREAYLGNPVAQRAVRLIAEGIGGAPLIASDPQLVALARARSGGQVLVETVAAQLLLHGNAYVQLLCDGAGGLAELFALRPERVKLEADALGWPAAYLYRVGDRTTRIAAEDARGRPGIVHIKAFHPLDDHYGAGCLGAAAGAVATHNAAARWNKALLDNAARPSGALVLERDGVMRGEEFARLQAELERSFAGAINAGRPMLLEGGLKWQAMSMTPADMDFATLKAGAARDIALAFGVPPMLLGLPGDNSYANFREANRALWRQAILPLADKILGSLSQAMAAWVPGAELRIDLDQVPALAEDRERMWRQVAGADFLTTPEKRARLGLG